MVIEFLCFHLLIWYVTLNYYSLNPWNISRFIMVYHLFIYYWIWFVNILMRIFAFIMHQRCWPIIFFFCRVFSKESVLLIRWPKYWSFSFSFNPSNDYSVQFSSVQFSLSVMSDSLRLHESQHASPPCPSPTPGVHSDPHPSSQWCHPAISSSVVPFSSCPQSLLASESFPMS